MLNKVQADTISYLCASKIQERKALGRLPSWYWNLQEYGLYADLLL